jgi:DoxX-like family
MDAESQDARLNAGPTARARSSGKLWTGRIMSGFVALFLLVDGGARLARFAPYVDGMTQFGYAADLAPWVGLSLLICTVLYVVPRTAILGAILVTGYLGGATATQVRVGNPWFLFPVALGVMAWGGLWLRDGRLRELIPVMKR